MLWNWVLLAGYNECNHGWIVAATAINGHAQDWTCQQSIMDWGGAHKSLSLPGKLLSPNELSCFKFKPMDNTTTLL